MRWPCVSGLRLNRCASENLGAYESWRKFWRNSHKHYVRAYYGIWTSDDLRYRRKGEHRRAIPYGPVRARDERGVGAPLLRLRPLRPTARNLDGSGGAFALH